MIAIQGEDIDLTLFLTKNKQPYESQAVTVRVIRQEDGFVEIASQALSEVDPGAYTYKWTNPPAVPINLLAEYEVNSTYTEGEEIQIVNLEMGEIRSAIDEMAGVIEDTQMLSGIVQDTLELGASISDTLDASAVIEDTLEVSGAISDVDEIEAIIQDSK